MATTVEDLTGEVVEAKEEEDLVLPGFRFHPTDEELVGFYLRRKVEKKRIGIDIIKQVDIYKYEPWDLPRISSVGDKEWYFFCLRGRKYRNSIRPNRVTGSGFWKATGIDRPVYSAGRGDVDCVGLKKSLVYYRGSAGKGTKTDWMMHEFRLPFGGSAGKSGGADNGCMGEAETWTICRIFKRTSSRHKKHLPTSRQVPSDHSNAKPSRAADEPKHSHNICVEDNESNHSIITYSEDTESNNSVMNFAEGNSQLYQGLWNQTVEAPSVTTHPDFFSSDPSDFIFDQGSSDELAWILELAADPPFDNMLDIHTPSC